jgi:hypothetical protein
MDWMKQLSAALPWEELRRIGSEESQLIGCQMSRRASVYNGQEETICSTFGGGRCRGRSGRKRVV